MNRHYWYYRFKADVAWLDQFIEDVEDYFRAAITESTEDAGVVSGMLVSERAAGQNFSVDVSSGSAYDVFGQRVFNNATVNVPFSLDSSGNPISVTGGGNARIVSVYAYYKVEDSSPVVDGFGNNVDTVGTERVEFKLVQGAIATSGSEVPGANPNDGGVLLAHVKITTSDSTIATADCNNVPRDRFSPWPRSLELDKHMRVYSLGSASWSGSSLITSATLAIECKDKTGATKISNLPAGTYNLSDGQCLIARLDRSNTPVALTLATYGQMAAGKYAITAESNLGVVDYLHRDDVILFRRRGALLEFVPGGYYVPASTFTPGSTTRPLSYRHAQGAANVTWTISHNFGTKDHLIQFYDDNGSDIDINPNSIDRDTNSTVVTWGVAQDGIAILMAI